jgi:hypothetical protein
MKTQKIAEVLGGIIGSMVLVLAFSQDRHPPTVNPKQAAQIDAPKASTVKGPAVRDITR